jgi:hypothetical protein
MRALFTWTLQTLLGALLVCGLSASARAQGLSTQQFCDGQQGAVDVLTPIISQFTAYVRPPAGATSDDVKNAAVTMLRIVLGRKCEEMRYDDHFLALQKQVSDLQAQISALQAKTAQMQTQIANAGSALKP